tara:strand:- start:3423 stop:3590 length:168 start_codon:yes stop_codon:yes gene_type:complete
MKTSTNNSKTSKETKQVQVKFFKEESIFNSIDRESLELYRQMMADRYGYFKDEQE